jgi:muramoyltetrapeptide carboxypeptidase
MLANEHFKYDANKKYLLFLEDHEKFSNVGAVSTYLGFIGQSIFMRNVVGLIFGHYSVTVPDDLLYCLERFGNKHNIPVVYTDDFGHGTRHAIFPIGVNASLDSDKQTLTFHCETTKAEG